MRSLPGTPAILTASGLEWRQIDATTVEASLRMAGGVVRVNQLFDAAGDIVGIVSEDRPYTVGGKDVPTRWIGRFSDYRLRAHGNRYSRGMPDVEQDTAMPIRTILACLCDAPSAAPLTEAASSLAERHGAHLIGLHAVEPVVIYPSTGMLMVAPSFEAHIVAADGQAEAIEAAFRTITARRGARAEWRRVDGGPGDDRMTQCAHGCDLAVMQCPAPGGRAAVDRMIRGSGRPVLLVPGDAGLAGAPRRVLLAHSDTEEAARAAFAMLPLLAAPCAIHIVHVGDETDEMRDGAMTDLSAALSRHGHDVTMVHRMPYGLSVGNALLREAAEMEADMIVAGAHGHSRAHAFLLGGATGDLISGAGTPLLLCG